MPFLFVFLASDRAGIILGQIFLLLVFASCFVPGVSAFEMTHSVFLFGYLK